MSQLIFTDRVLESYKGDTKAAQESYLQFDSIVRYGRDLDRKRVKMEDAVALPNAPVMVPLVITEILREGIEPMLIGPSLFQRLQYQPGMEVMMPTIGALYADEVGKNNMSYPEFDVDMGTGSTQQMHVNKYGLMLKFPDRIIKHDQWGIYGMWVRMAGAALARHKEVNIFNSLLATGTVVFDNTTAANGMKGTTTGRDMLGVENGSFTMDDLFDMYAQVLAQGFVPDTLLVNPLAWSMFCKDPVMREFAIQNGGGSFFQGWDGQFNQQSGWSNFGGLGEGQGQNVSFDPAGVVPSAMTGYQQTMDSRPRLPQYFPTPLRIVASPFMPLATGGSGPYYKETDILLFDSKNLGAIAVDQDPMVEEWRDIGRELNNVKISEAYGLHILEQGQGIAVAKDVRLVANEFVLPTRATVDAAGLNMAPLTGALPNP